MRRGAWLNLYQHCNAPFCRAYPCNLTNLMQNKVVLHSNYAAEMAAFEAKLKLKSESGHSSKTSSVVRGSGPQFLPGTLMDRGLMEQTGNIEASDPTGAGSSVPQSERGELESIMAGGATPPGLPSGAGSASGADSEQPEQASSSPGGVQASAGAGAGSSAPPDSQIGTEGGAMRGSMTPAGGAGGDSSSEDEDEDEQARPTRRKGPNG